MNKGILIDPVTETVTKVEVESWKDISPMLDCDMFTCVTWKGHTIYTDDEGLLMLNENSKFVKFMSYPQPLVGKCLVLGVDDSGESQDVFLSVGEMKEFISFLDLNSVRHISR